MNEVCEEPLQRSASYGGAWSTKRNWVICVLLVLATIQCVQSIFTVNVSLVNLKEYAEGKARMPFQGRIAMIPVVRWAGNNRAMQKVSAHLEGELLIGHEKLREGYSAEKVGVALVGLVAMLATVGFAGFWGQRHLPEAWWLPASLFVYMLYVTYAARSQAQLWYPYDLLHFALFGVAAVCILEGSWAAGFCLFVLDLPVRETCIYLVLLMLAMGYVRRQWRVVPWAVAMLVLWIPFRIYITHRYAANDTDVQIQWSYWRHALLNPFRWGQMASAFGFLAVPFCFGFKYLTREEQFFVYAAIPGLLVTALFGIWFETRIWDEWLLPAAILMSLQTVRYLTGLHRTRVLNEQLN